MDKYELSAPDFELLNNALRIHDGLLSSLFDRHAKQQGLAAKRTEELAKSLNTCRDLRERFSKAHTAWIETEE